jgi:hypothetical protein
MLVGDEEVSFVGVVILYEFVGMMRRSEGVVVM